MKQRELSIWLRAICVLMVLLLIAACIFAAPALGRAAQREFPQRETLGTSVKIFLWLTALPCFASLVLAWNIFTQIGRDNSFCRKNALRLWAVSILALADTVLYIGAGVLMAVTGLMNAMLLARFVLVIIFGLTMCVIAAALSHLTLKAAKLREDSDLTI